MKLYNLKAGMNPRRVRIFMAEKGLHCETVDIDMDAGENRRPEFLAKNPLGTLPVLELDDGTIIAESMAICRYLEELHPEPALLGRTALERAQVEMWNRRMELELLVPTTSVFLHTHPFWDGRITQYGDYGQSCRDLLLKRFAWLDGEIAGRDYIAGNSYSVADITAQCALIVAKACKLPVPPELAHLTAWFARVSSRPTARA